MQYLYEDRKNLLNTKTRAGWKTHILPDAFLSMPLDKVYLTRTKPRKNNLQTTRNKKETEFKKNKRFANVRSLRHSWHASSGERHKERDSRQNDEIFLFRSQMVLHTSSEQNKDREKNEGAMSIDQPMVTDQHKEHPLIIQHPRICHSYNRFSGK